MGSDDDVSAVKGERARHTYTQRQRETERQRAVTLCTFVSACVGVCVRVHVGVCGVLLACVKPLEKGTGTYSAEARRQEMSPPLPDDSQSNIQ